MADWTEAQVRDAALMHLGIAAAGESASGDDDKLAQDNYASLYARLHRKGHAPFPRNEVPEWAQTPLAHILAGTMLGAFGFTGERRRALDLDAKRAMHDLQSGASHAQPPLEPEGSFF